MNHPQARPHDIEVTRRGLRLGGRFIPCTIGRLGVTGDKREGDGASPVGEWRVTGMLYRPDRIAPPQPWARPIGPGDLWSDDPRDRDYNHPVRAPHDYSHESLRRPDPLYDLVILTDWNWPLALPGRGSAIFLHQWRRPGYPTAGCVAMARADLRWLAARITPGSRILIRQR